MAGEAERAWLEARARVLGFDAIGFSTPPGPGEPFPEGERFLEWLERGYAASMSYLGETRTLRADPRTMLADLQTVVALAKSYPRDAPEPEVGEGRVARYARGRDYHNVLGRRVRKLLRDYMLAYPGEQGFSFVDRGAVLEKAWAARAGLGWIAKNTLVLHPERGSYQLLAVVYLTTRIEADPPVADQCGACRLCLDACPTGAFVAPYVLDARLCLSALTIEERGAWPDALKELAGDHLFGCDVCQEVCPWNRHARVSLDPAFGPAETPLHEPLAGVLALDADGFVTLTRGRPLARPGRDGLVRNACIVAGNALEPGGESFAVLERLTSDASAVVREAATWAVARIRARTSSGDVVVPSADPGAS